MFLDDSQVLAAISSADIQPHDLSDILGLPDETHGIVTQVSDTNMLSNGINDLGLVDRFFQKE